MNESKKIIEIEYLRALAIVFTLFHHIVFYLFPSPQTSPFLVGLYSHFTFFSGVDLFFCISGFVIFNSFWKLVESSRSIRSHFRAAVTFWMKRFFRLLPSAWLWIGIYLLCSYWFNSGHFGNFNQNLQDMKAAFFQYANFYGLNCWGPGKTMDCGPNGIYWSLSLEEQFYFVLPFLFLIVGRYLFGFVMALIFLVQFFLPRVDWSIGWALRTDAIALGVLISILSRKWLYQDLNPRFLNRAGWTKYIFISALVFLMAYIPAMPNAIPFSLGLLALICAALVWLASYDQGYILPHSNPLHKILLWLGSRSYSIYLVHIVAFKLSCELVVDSFVYLLPAGLILTFILSELNFRFIEKPLRIKFYKMIDSKSLIKSTN